MTKNVLLPCANLKGHKIEYKIKITVTNIYIYIYNTSNNNIYVTGKV